MVQAACRGFAGRGGDYFLSVGTPGRRNASVERRPHHQYIVEEDSPGWQNWLAFRDHLRESVADRNEYVRIKRELAAVDDEDRPAYRPRRSSPGC
ncbi:hypothetical protein GCM10009744_01970 [Kribbella alba]|uniref:GrpB family protein n=1 Tax=Kribbella alba TaxID=190197 RepID=A0ABP4QVW3_9ACTN